MSDNETKIKDEDSNLDSVSETFDYDHDSSKEKSGRHIKVQKEEPIKDSAEDIDKIDDELKNEVSAEANNNDDSKLKEADIPPIASAADTESSKDDTANNKDSKFKVPPSPKKTRRRNIIIAIIVILICLLSVAGAWAYSFFNLSFDGEEEKEIEQELSEASFDEPFYMLLIGTDTREGDSSYSLSDGRSDSCILVRIDPINYVVTMISIPRDTKITTSDGYVCKFNELYATGGVAATIKQVKKMTGADISHYAEISFNGLSDMIDAVGGVEVDVPQEIDDEKSGPYVPKGLNNLTGEQALSFSRSRNFADGDFTREADQRVLIKALINKAFHAGPDGVTGLLRAAKNFVRTDLRLGEMISLATQFIMSGQETQIYNAMIPVFNAGENGISYVKVDEPALNRMMKMVENGEDPSMVEIDSGATVGSSRDAEELANKQKEYYQAHPDSPGKITNSTSSSSGSSNSYYSSESEYQSYYDY